VGVERVTCRNFLARIGDTCVTPSEEEKGIRSADVTADYTIRLEPSDTVRVNFVPATYDRPIPSGL
jgi:hypothetical protein